MNTLQQRLDGLIPRHLALLLTACVYFLAGHLGQSLFSLQPSNITLIWLPSGIGLVMLMNWQYRALVYVFFASFAVNLPGMWLVDFPIQSLLHTLVAALVDSLAPLFAYLLLNRVLPFGTRSANELFRFVLFVGVLPTLLSSILLSSNLVLGHYIAPDKALDMGMMFFFADILGIVLVYQLYIGWIEANAFAVVRFRSQLMPIAGLAVFCLLGAYFQISWLFYLISPLLVVLAFEVSRFYLALFSTFSMLFIIVVTVHGIGPFIASTQQQTNTDMMAFVLASSLTIFGISLQRAQLHRSEKEKLTAEKEAQHDALSGLLNRRAFIPLLANIDAAARQHQAWYCIAMLDIDNFKAINDTYGHSVGDRVIQQLSLVISQHIYPHDLAARLGGEEFAVVLTEMDVVQAFEVLDRVRTSFAETPIVADQATIYCQVSIGVCGSHQALTVDTLLHCADKALYHAKRTGKNRVCEFTTELM